MNNLEPTFRFKRFAVTDRRCGMKVGTDGVLIGAWASMSVSDSRQIRILDVGAGCGLISLMMAQRYADARIVAVEIDEGASEDAGVNISSSPWAERISLVNGDFKSIEGDFDLIVSNPPFFVNGELAPDDARARARHAAALSPLSLIEWGSKHLREDGRLAFIAPVELSTEIETQAVFSRMTVLRRVDVRTSPRRGVTRTLWDLGCDSSTGNYCPSEPLTINSPEYINLTKEFYLQF